MPVLGTRVPRAAAARQALPVASGPAGRGGRRGRRAGDLRKHVGLLEVQSPFQPNKERESGTFFFCH